MSRRHPFAAFRKQGSSLLCQLLDHKTSPPPIFSCYMKCQRKLEQNRKRFSTFFFSPHWLLSAHALSWAAFSDLTFSFPLLKELQHPLGSQLLTSPLQSYQDKTSSSEDLHSNCLSLSKYSIYSNKLQSHSVSVPI